MLNIQLVSNKIFAKEIWPWSYLRMNLFKGANSLKLSRIPTILVFSLLFLCLRAESEDVNTAPVEKESPPAPVALPPLENSSAAPVIKNKLPISNQVSQPINYYGPLWLVGSFKLQRELFKEDEFREGVYVSYQNESQIGPSFLTATVIEFYYSKARKFPNRKRHSFFSPNISKTLNFEIAFSSFYLMPFAGLGIGYEFEGSSISYDHKMEGSLGVLLKTHEGYYGQVKIARQFNSILNTGWKSDMNGSNVVFALGHRF